MYYPKCGKEIEKDSKFCGYCGYELGKEERVVQKIEEKTVSNVRPWIRFFARITDYWIGGLILGVIFSVFAPSMLKVSIILLGILLMFIWVFVEAVLLSTWGTTPGKWLFKITITDMVGKNLSFSNALNRSFSVWLASGIPIVNFITLAIAYRDLAKVGFTTWDREVGCQVSHKNIGASRVIPIMLLFIGFIFLIGFMEELPRNGEIEILKMGIMSSMSGALIIFGSLAFIFGLIMLIVNAGKKPIKHWGVVAVSGVVLFIIGGAIFPAFTISSLHITPKEVAAGKNVLISADVENVGLVKGTYRTILMVDSVEIETKDIILAAGAKETIHFIIITGNNLGIHKVEIGGLTDTFRVLRPAQFKVGGLIVTPNPVKKGEKTTAKIRIENTGCVNGGLIFPIFGGIKFPS